MSALSNKQRRRRRMWRRARRSEGKSNLTIRIMEFGKFTSKRMASFAQVFPLVDMDEHEQYENDGGTVVVIIPKDSKQ